METRAKTQWLAEGDRNTKFFHAQASKRSAQNHISGLKDNMGLIQTDLEVIGANYSKLFQEYFLESEAF